MLKVVSPWRAVVPLRFYIREFVYPYAVLCAGAVIEGSNRIDVYISDGDKFVTQVVDTSTTVAAGRVHADAALRASGVYLL